MKIIDRLIQVILAIVLLHAGSGQAATLSTQEQVGKRLFFDANLSLHRNQSCAACHAPEVGWTGPDASINRMGAVYEASVPGRFGNRKPPSSAYATASPMLHYDGRMKSFVGGSFWDGRATGELLGSPAADQAVGPFLNPLEQALPDAAALVQRVCGSDYADLFKTVWGAQACADVNKAVGYIGLSIAAYEGSREVNRFDSKFDAYLAGKVSLTSQEREGLRLFEGKGKCAQCHTSKPGPDKQPPLFTDFTYDNIGMPRNPDNPFYYHRDINPMGAAWVDLGLGGFLQSVAKYRAQAQANLGKHKVPTLRNVALRPTASLVKAYGHNGYFKNLKEVVHFYNTRDTLPACGEEGGKPGTNCWPLPEVGLNVNRNEMGRLGLGDAEEDAIVAFLGTLSDGYTAAGKPESENKRQ
jgi:cytochrome c peroxidase